MATLTSKQIFEIWVLFKELDPDEIPGRLEWMIIKDRLEKIIDDPQGVSQELPGISLHSFGLEDDGSYLIPDDYTYPPPDIEGFLEQKTNDKRTVNRNSSSFLPGKG